MYIIYYVVIVYCSWNDYMYGFLICVIKLGNLGSEFSCMVDFGILYWVSLNIVWSLILGFL